MPCPYTQCACNSIHGSCRWNGDPETCAFGMNQKKIEKAHEEGVKEGLEIAKKAIEEKEEAVKQG